MLEQDRRDETDKNEPKLILIYQLGNFRVRFAAYLL